jgi:hypothetical protein
VRLPLWMGIGLEVPARVAADLMATIAAHAS